MIRRNLCTCLYFNLHGGKFRVEKELSSQHLVACDSANHSTKGVCLGVVEILKAKE